LTPYLQQKTLYPPLIHRRISKNLGLIVVIPAYNEPQLLRSLMALKRCQLHYWDVEVIVVINDAEKDTPAIKKTNQQVFEQAKNWSVKNSTPRLQYRILYQEDMPDKFAGVGLARKIGMDEACYRFEKIKKKNGIIICFDADSSCQPNYFQAIEEHFKKYTKSAACSIHFEHPLTGAEYEPEVYEAIAAYELHLRYFINAQRWAGAPFAYQTIGSSMAVRSRHYQKQGGMNKRKAGEDFYFLHKFISVGKCSNLKTTTVIPSPRMSDRVPFGTGKAVKEILENREAYNTYHPQTFKDLKALFKIVPSLFTTPFLEIKEKLSPCLNEFLDLQQVEQKLDEIKGNTTTAKAFTKRFYHWFNAFLLMKFAHFARDHYYENVVVGEAASWLLEELSGASNDLSIKELLIEYRSLVSIIRKVEPSG